MKTIGSRLRYFREEIAHCTRAEFTRGLAVSMRTLEKYEKDETTPDAQFLTRLNAKYNDTINLNWLLTGQGDIYLSGGSEPQLAKEGDSAFYDFILERMHKQLDRIYKERDFLKLAAIQSILNLADPEQKGQEEEDKQ